MFPDYFSAIMSVKRSGTQDELKAVKKDVTALCADYVQALKFLKPPPRKQWAKGASDALISCYSVNTKALSSHKDSILKSLISQAEINVQRCPYCMLNDPKTWDHYMPKDDFPEYSVFHANLLYVCYGCNQRKSNYFSPTELVYCHPYFSVDINSAILHCEVKVDKGKLSIDYYGAGYDGYTEQGNIAQRHLERLGLVDRFKIEASSTVADLISELHQNFPNGVTQSILDGVLQRRYSDSMKKLGCNAWDSRLWHGIAACGEFISYANDEMSKLGTLNLKGFREASPKRSL
ncbi:hypothetical protein ACI703_01185 [Isoptericola jiangsuensis]|uniref:hypothetical protein n=1 Tax=Isoptericola jiangsuensis TaxID=548579 RepID=UPI00386A986B